MVVLVPYKFASTRAAGESAPQHLKLRKCYADSPDHRHVAVTNWK
jgi:hypothetical protein